MNANMYRLVTFVIVIITVVGGAVTITNPHDLPFRSYIQDIALAWGLLGVAHGIDGASRP